MAKNSVSQLAYDIYCIDVRYIRARLACSFLIVHEGKAAFVECGTSHSTPYLLSTLKDVGLSVNDVEFIIPTHVHLDHAGGAGTLMQACPNAVLLVHPKGARHLINPQRLIESARGVYGAEKFDKLYGDIIPVDEYRVSVAEDHSEFSLNGRILSFTDTPGHARHHFCVYDELSQGWFTGDTFGLSYPDIHTSNGRYIMPTTTPTQFEPDAWQASLKKLLDTKPQCMYMTHYGRLDNIVSYASKLSSDLDVYCDLALKQKDHENRQQILAKELMNYTLNDLEKSGCSMPQSTIEKLLAGDIQLNAQGLDVWLNRIL
ncbi:MAG: MBL fold metallo-hydrolase [Pseudomonadota bacterium]